MGARPWILDRRNGIAPGICNRLVVNSRLLCKQLPSELEWSLRALISGGGYLTSQLVSVSNPVDLVGRDDKDGDLMFAQGTSLTGHFAQQRKLRMLAQEAVLEEVANSELRRLLRGYQDR